MRLDQFLCHATGLTRSLAQREIRRGEVQVEQTVVKDPSVHVSATTHVSYRGQIVAPPVPCYLMLNKPLGYVCAARDVQHRSVLELLDVPKATHLHIAGRLDLDATGLLLLTDDGAWSHGVTAPRREVVKVYRVTLAEPLPASAVQAFARGVQLQDEPKPCRPAIIERLADTDVRVSITEGKYHQVKRMFAAVGNGVVALHRERIGAVALDAALAPGASRPLTAAEIESF